MNAASSWRGDDGRGPRLGRKGKLWLARRVRAALPCVVSEFRERLVSWYVQHADRFATWVDADEYRGPGFANGYWRFDAGAVVAGFETARTAVFKEIDDERCASLDDWLELHARGALWYRGDAGGMRTVATVTCSAMTGAEIADRVIEYATRARERGENVRCACGVVFTADRRKAAYCAECRERRRKAQEARILARRIEP